MPLLLNFLGAVVFSRIASPFVLTPIVIMSILLSFTSSSRAVQNRSMVLVWTAAVVLAPFALEWLGWLPETWHIANDTLLTRSEFFRLHGGRAEEIALVAANLGFILLGGLFALSLNARRRAAQRQLQMQAWHLRQLLPASARPWQTRVAGQRTMAA